MARSGWWVGGLVLCGILGLGILWWEGSSSPPAAPEGDASGRPGRSGAGAGAGTSGTSEPRGLGPHVGAEEGAGRSDPAARSGSPPAEGRGVSPSNGAHADGADGSDGSDGSDGEAPTEPDSTRGASSEGRAPLPAALREEIREATRRDTDGLVRIQKPDGATQVHLQGRFQHVPVARVNEDGTFTVEEY